MAGYGTDGGFATWATGAGHPVPSGTVAAARQRGSDYIDGLYGARFRGVPTGGADQEREWPRTGAVDRYGNALDPNIVPARVISASYEAALMEMTAPGSLITTTSGATVKREKVGPLEVEYATSESGSSASSPPVSTAIEGLLGPLLAVPMPGAWVV